MVSFSLARLAVVASAFLFFAPVNSVPTSVTAFDGLGQQARDILARATPAPPHWVVYGDQFVSGTTGPPATSVVAVRRSILSFLLVEGAWDKAFEWTTYTDAERATVKAQYAAAGIKLLVSAFGSTDVPTSSGLDPIAMATTMGNWVKQYNLDGIDVDYEDFNAFDAGDGKAEAWLISFTTQLRTILPQGTYIITHARGYLKVHSSVGSLIDWYNVQGVNEYTTCANLLTTSSTTWPNTALFQIAASGVPLTKLVIGKPASTAFATSGGFMDGSTLATCVATAKTQGWTGGAMVWEYPGAAAAWIKTVRGSAWPV
ncbi:glycoside hydrolase family 18 protein [Mycena latifolia]|nr:glycoside hydrolase family 18 protein [Mycena latifolia]